MLGLWNLTRVSNRMLCSTDSISLHPAVKYYLSSRGLPVATIGIAPPTICYAFPDCLQRGISTPSRQLTTKLLDKCETASYQVEGASRLFHIFPFQKPTCARLTRQSPWCPINRSQPNSPVLPGRPAAAVVCSLLSLFQCTVTPSSNEYSTPESLYHFLPRN